VPPIDAQDAVTQHTLASINVLCGSVYSIPPEPCQGGDSVGADEKDIEVAVRRSARGVCTKGPL